MKEIDIIRSPKEQFLDEIKETLEDHLPEQWNKKDIEELKDSLTSNKMKSSIFSAIPMVCRPTCPFLDTCEYAKKGTAPFQLSKSNKKSDGRCIYELAIVASFMGDYIEQLEIDVTNWVEMSQVRDLVDQEVQLLRKTKYLAKEDFIQENVVGVDEDGDPIMKKDLHQAVYYEDKIHKRRTQMFKQILATRESRVKANSMQMDSAQSMANLIASMRRIEKEEQEALKKQLGIVDVDEYILEDQKENTPELPEG